MTTLAHGGEAGIAGGGGAQNPVTELPGDTPASPLITEEPVLVTAPPPSTAKSVAAPRGMGVVMAFACVGTITTAVAAINAVVTVAIQAGIARR
ncbi:hypothetical protein [Streptomyces sp. LN785]|uniref:hypothetical protein n=1 Tax=Streptomyces sp. LN785 TaxID=3112983 RepID=UPI00371F04B3